VLSDGVSSQNYPEIEIALSVSWLFHLQI
jgi:hypothetical protein